MAIIAGTDNLHFRSGLTTLPNGRVIKLSRSRNGDMEEFCWKLKDMGYERVEMIDTADGKFMSKGESRRLLLTGSTLLIGKK